MKLKTTLLAALFACGHHLFALEIGDPAPPLQIAEWVKGEKVQLTVPAKQVYVVEFWATWCPPCRVSIPHLTQLHHRFQHRGVTFIGISNEDSATVKPFVEAQGQRMAYTVAVDEGSQTTQAFMGEFGVGGIPHAFVIDKHGKVVWHGHPMGSLGDVLNLVLADQFDPEVVPTMDTAVQHARDYLAQARQGKTKEELAKLGPGIIREAEQNVDLLNHFAWTILTDTRVKTRDVPLALEAAKVAFETTKGSNPAVIDTYARALFESGDVQGAIQQQQKAVDLATHQALKDKLQAALKQYQAEVDKPAGQ